MEFFILSFSSAAFLLLQEDELGPGEIEKRGIYMNLMSNLDPTMESHQTLENRADAKL